MLNGAFRQKRSIIIGLTVLFIFISLEAALRVRQYIRYGVLVSDDDISIPDLVLGKVFKPGYKLVGKTSSLTINRWGFRGHDFPLEKGNKVFRIFVLGDSVVFDRYAWDDDKAWPARLEKELNRMQGKYRIEVVNAGVPGYYIDTLYLYLTDMIVRFKPDMVILYEGANDINYQSRVQYGPPPDKAPSTKSFNLSHLREKYFVWFNLMRNKTASLLAIEQKSARIDGIGDEAVKSYTEGVRKIIEYCRANGIEMVTSTVPRSFRRAQPKWLQARMAGPMMIFNPYLSVEGLNDAFDRFNYAVKEISVKNDVFLIDTDAVIPADEKYFKDHVHFTDDGEELVSQIFAKALAQRYFK